jgi:hypothetical protein
VDAALDVCQRSPSGGSCSRPDTYTFRTIMRNAGGAWVVVGASCEETNIVR